MGGDRQDEAQANLVRFGRQVRALRVERDLTQEQLAHAAGFHRAVIGFVERGERDFGISHLWPLAAALDVEISNLFGSDGAGSAQDPTR